MKQKEKHKFLKLILFWGINILIVNFGQSQVAINCIFSAGPDKVILRGGETTIGDDGGLPQNLLNIYTFEWTNSVNTSEVETGFPLIVSPEEPTTYYLKVFYNGNEIPNFNNAVVNVVVVTAGLAGVGFVNDHKITKWETDELIDPNDETLVYLAPDLLNDPVCYTQGIAPTGFLYIAFNDYMNSLPFSTSIEQVITSLDVKITRITGGVNMNVAEVLNVSIGQVVYQNGFYFCKTNPVSFSESWTYDLAKIDEVFKWEVRTDDSSDYINIGNSTNPFYWIKNNPTYPTFSSASWKGLVLPGGGLPGPGGIDFSPLYDLALEKATLYYATTYPTSPSANLKQKLMLGIASEIIYNHTYWVPPTEHPLKNYEHGKAVCHRNAMLFVGLLRSVGLAGEMVYTWGGKVEGVGNSQIKTRVFFKRSSNNNSSSLSFNKQLYDEVPAIPHFQYHAVVKSEGIYFDPSYGESSGNQIIQALEVGKWPCVNSITVDQLEGPDFPPGDPAEWENYWRVCPLDQIWECAH
ncbi:MAG: hypothetical protein ACI9RM_001419 [Ulvibacter sp.]|jgi:hypothetical protein